MHRTGGNMENVALKGFFLTKHVSYPILLERLEVSHLVHARLEAAHDARSRLGLADKPHFILAQAAFPLHGQFIVGMNLHRQIRRGVYPFEKQGKLQAETTIDVFPHQIAHIYFHQVYQGVAFQKAVRHHRFLAFQTRKHPRLAAFFHLSVIQSQHFLDSRPAPYFLLEDRNELQRIQGPFPDLAFPTEIVFLDRVHTRSVVFSCFLTYVT